MWQGGIRGRRRDGSKPQAGAGVSNPDSFINEVTEEVRRDRLFGLLRRYGWIGVLVVLLVVGGAAYLEWRKATERAEAQGFGNALLAVLETDTTAAERAAALGAVEADGGRAAVLAMLRAGEARAAGDLEGALAILGALADSTDAPAAYRQMAALKRVMLGGGALPQDAREAVLSGLAQPGEPLRPLALEQMALLRLEQGESAAAREILAGLLEEPGVTQDLRQRVVQLIVALGGEPPAA